MKIYKLPKIDFQKFKNKISKIFENTFLIRRIILVLVGFLIGFFVFLIVLNYFPAQIQGLTGFLKISESQDLKFQQSSETIYEPIISYEQATIDAVKSASPSVVSIIISKDLPVYEREWINPFGDLMPGFEIPQYVQRGTEKKQIGAGSGFIVSEDGLVLTNKHVVSDSKAEYTVFTNNGEKYTAKVLALDPMQDLAVLKIETDIKDKKFISAELGNSDTIQVGQTAIAIGNALGQFTNTVSVGVVSGLQRTVSAYDSSKSFSETLQGTIQTDAAINSGNSGGPLLNLKGEVIGVNTAMAEGAQNIGFAIPINTAKRAIKQVIEINKIVYPFLGVRYAMINQDIKEKNNLSVDYGVLILKGADGEKAITPDSSAEKAGIKEGDIILELNGEKITENNPLSEIILKYNPGDEIVLKILRQEDELEKKVILGERSS
jgi:serine protease Do